MECPLLDAFRDRPDDHRPAASTSRCSAPASSSAPRRAARRWRRRRCAPPVWSAPSPTSATASPTAARSTRSRPSRSRWTGHARRCNHLDRDRRLDPHDPRPGLRDGRGARRAGVPRRRPRDLDGHDHRRRPRPRRGRAGGPRCSGSTPTPTTTPPRPRRRATCTAWRCRFATGDPILAPLLGDRPLDAMAPADITLFGARSIDPEEKARLRAHGVDAIDMRAIDERGVSALLAERIARWQAQGVLAARQLRPRLPRPGGRAGHRHRRARRRHLPRGAPGHGDALRRGDRRLGRRRRAQPLPRRARPLRGRRHRTGREPLRPHRPRPRPGRRRPPPDGDPDARHRRPDRPRDPPRRAQLQAARRGADQGRGRLGHRHRGQPLPRLPRRLFGGEPGPLPPADPRGDGRAGAAG